MGDGRFATSRPLRRSSYLALWKPSRRTICSGWPHVFLMRIDTIRCCIGSAVSAYLQPSATRTKWMVTRCSQEGRARSLYWADLGLLLLNGNCFAASDGGCVRGLSLEFRLSKTIGTNRTEQRLAGRQNKKGVALRKGNLICKTIRGDCSSCCV